MKKFYITTPIYYVNDRVHIGHSYTTVAADVLARYHRLKGKRTFFLVGTDEHGEKIEKVARNLGETPKQLCDKNSLFFKKAWQSLNISYDSFLRTTEKNHIKAVQKVLDVLYRKKFIYKGVYKGLYCLGCEQYKTKSDLVRGRCPQHQTKPKMMREESYLFRLSKFKDILENKIKNEEFKIRPKERKNEVLGFLKNGLQDISISREKVKWGIPLPFDKKMTCYVWLDAFLNYLTGLGWKGDPKKIPDFWPPDLQLMSKDIIRVHATIWPALLLALDIPLPRQLFVHGYFTVEGQKMSKSLMNVIFPEEMIKKFGVDSTRYLLLSTCPFGKDGDVSWQKFEGKYNSDLAKGLGNLVARVITLVKNSKFQIPNPRQITNPKLQAEINKTWEDYQKALDEFKLNEVLVSIWDLISFCDKYIEKERPWEEVKSAGWRKKEVIGNLLFALDNIAKLLQPFLPETSEKIFKQLKTRKSKPLFPRI